MQFVCFPVLKMNAYHAFYAYCKYVEIVTAFLTSCERMVYLCPMAKSNFTFFREHRVIRSCSQSLRKIHSAKFFLCSILCYVRRLKSKQFHVRMVEISTIESKIWILTSFSCFFDSPIFF